MTDLAKIEEIYHAALSVPLELRQEFVRTACAGDDSLRREVESFLSLTEKAASFIESTPGDLAAALMENKEDDENLIGRELNHYLVISLLGAGGMGKVYLAEDTRLGRKIALKLLPSQLSSNPERRARFEQEARSASALNHPNIITIHGFEEFDGFNFIATEFIDGETLRERLQRSPLSIAETLNIAVQLASALEAAHAVGVIHRDIKPANIMLRRDRIAKILDFGLAKLTAANSDSFDTKDLTGQKRVMGTINYMSPEQALGERLDARTDIFSLGVVIYEMLSGIQPFRGNSEAAVYDAILNRDAAPLTDFKQDLPLDLIEIVSRAMRKNADERFQTAAELRVTLENARHRLNTGEMIAASEPDKRKINFLRKPSAVFAAVIIIIFLTAGFLTFFGRLQSGASPIRNINYTQLTKSSGAEMYPSLSPDGKTFIFSSRVNGNWNIFFQRVGGMNAVNLTKDSKTNDWQAVYSPDGAEIAFRSDRDGGGIFLMGATGENVRRLTDVGFYPSWSPDSKEIVFCTENFEDPMNRGIFSQLWAVNVVTGEKRKLTEEDSIEPNWSPSGARIAFWSYNAGNARRDIWTISAKGGEAPMRVTDDAAIDWNPVWSPDGKYLYFLSDRGGSMNVWRVSIDEKTGKVLGEPETVPTPSVYTQHLSFSRDGRNFLYAQSVNYSSIFKTEFDPLAEKASLEAAVEITQSGIWATNPELSPDGEWLVFDSTGDKQEDIFLIKPDGTGLRQLTNDNFKDRAPRFSPDGKQIAFFSDRSGKYQGWVINTDGSNLQQVTDIIEPGTWAQLPVWAPDGKRLLYNRSFNLPIIFDSSAPFTNQQPETLPIEKTLDSWVMISSWAPDDKKLAGYTLSNGSGVSGVVIYNFDTRHYEKIFDFGNIPKWLNDSRRLLVYRQDKIYLLDTQTQKVKEILSVAPSRLRNVSVSKDNRTIFYAQQKTEADIWLGSLE